MPFRTQDYDEDSTSSGLVKVSVTDTTADYLFSKLVAGANITLTQDNIGGYETITISASGGATPAGLDTQVQFNDGGVFGADSGFTFDKITGQLDVVGQIVGGSLSIAGGGFTVDGSGNADANALIVGTLTYPNTDSTAGFVVTTDGAGNLSLQAPTGGITLQTNGIANGSQTLLNLIDGTNITIVDDGFGGITINSTGGGTLNNPINDAPGGVGGVMSVDYVNHQLGNAAGSIIFDYSNGIGYDAGGFTSYHWINRTLNNDAGSLSMNWNTRKLHVGATQVLDWSDSGAGTAWLNMESSGARFTIGVITTSLVAAGLTYPIADGSSGEVLTTDGAGNLTFQPAGGGGSGDVVGPASATDNAITRYDSTTGKLIQNSTVTLDDNGKITGARWQRRVLALSANSATPSINTDLYDYVHITAQTANITSLTSGLSGTPDDGDMLTISVTATGTITIATGASFEAGSATEPTATNGTQRLDWGYKWNTETSKWRCISNPMQGLGTVTSVSVVSTNGFAGTVATATTTPAITISTTVTGLLKGNGAAISAASAGTDYEVPITFSTGLTRTVNTVTVNTTQNIAKLSNLTSNGFVKTSGGDGTLSVDTTSYQTLDAQLTSIAGLSYTGNALKVVRVNAGETDFELATISAGTGDVVGPASAVNNNVVFFDGTTGKLIKDSGLTLAGSNTGDQTITLTSDVTGSGTGSFAATIANDAVTYAKMQNVSATDRILGRSTAGAGDVEEIVCTPTARSLLDDTSTAAMITTLGLNNTQIDNVQFTIENGGLPVVAGQAATTRVPYGCTIVDAEVTTEGGTGSCVLDVWKDTYANYPPTVADTITASAKPTVTTAIKSTDSTLTGWTTSVAAGAYLTASVDSSSTFTKIVLSLKIIKT